MRLTRTSVKSFAVSVAAGLVANAVSALFVLFVASIGGGWNLARGLAVFAVGVLAIGAVVVIGFAVRDYRQYQLPPELNLGRIIVGGVLYAVLFGMSCWALWGLFF